MRLKIAHNDINCGNVGVFDQRWELLDLELFTQINEPITPHTYLKAEIASHEKDVLEMAITI